MRIEDIIIIAIVLIAVAGVIFYIYRSKKRGQKCIGCPYAKSCKGNCGSANKKTDC